MELVPRDGRYLRSRVQVSWSCTSTGNVVEEAQLMVAGKDAERFGKALKLPVRGAPGMPGQKSLRDFFPVSRQGGTQQGIVIKKEDTQSPCGELPTPSPATPPRREQASEIDCTE